MALVQIVQWDGGLNSNDVFAWRWLDRKNPGKSNELGNWTQLIVNEAQEAILFKDGQALDLFGPGRHTLSTDNIPVLRRLMNLPTGGESAFKAYVWFINKVNVLDISRLGNYKDFGDLLDASILREKIYQRRNAH